MFVFALEIVKRVRAVFCQLRDLTGHPGNIAVVHFHVIQRQARIFCVAGGNGFYSSNHRFAKARFRHLFLFTQAQQ